MKIDPNNIITHFCMGTMIIRNIKNLKWYIIVLRKY